MATYNPGSNFTVSSGYGPRDTGIPGASTFHRGQDYSAATGTSIPAASEGTVYFTGTLPGYGNVVVIEHHIQGEMVYSLYGHMDQPSLLEKGDTVFKGDTVGTVGNTGIGSGPHLHFEVIKDLPNPLKKGHGTYDPNDFDFANGEGTFAPGWGPFTKPDNWTGGGVGDANGNGIADIHESKINIGTSTFFTAAARLAPIRRDPLTLDLDGDGLETVGTSAGVLFDQTGSGVRQGTGWVAPDDGFLVLDRNGNGVIDSGRELFGDSTHKSTGQTALDGFDALRDLDSNADGKISSTDAQFGNLRVWRDHNQDGISQSGELYTLSSLQIASINVAASANSQTLANGNQIADLGTYTRTDGSTGTTGEISGTLGDINLGTDVFHRQFTDTLDTSAVAALPDMQACPELGQRGSGGVRDLREAANDGEWRVAV